MNLKDLTLFIPVRDRQENILPQLQYYKDVNCKKIIADSSLTELSDKSIFNGTGFEYIYYGPMKWSEKFIRVTNEVIDTKYIVYNNDDDRVLLPALIECVTFMRDNPQYSVCDGRYCKVTEEVGRYEASYKSQRSRKFYSDCPKERALYGITTNPRIHGVLRTSDWHLTNELYRDNPFMPIQTIGRNPGFDVVSNFIFAIKGNLKTLSCNYMIKNPSGLCGRRTVNVDNIRKELNLDAQNKEQIGLTKKCMLPIANILADEMKISIDEALKAVKDIYYTNKYKKRL